MNYVYRIKLNSDGSFDLPEEVKRLKGTTFDMVLKPVDTGSAPFDSFKNIANNLPTLQGLSEDDILNVIQEVRKNK